MDKYLRWITSFVSSGMMRVSISPSSSPSIRRPRSRVKHQEQERVQVGRRVGGTRGTSGRAHRLTGMPELRVPTTSGVPRDLTSAEICDQRQEEYVVKFCKESSKRESEVMVTANELLGVENLDDETRKILEKGSRHL